MDLRAPARRGAGARLASTRFHLSTRARPQGARVRLPTTFTCRLGVLPRAPPMLTALTHALRRADGFRIQHEGGGAPQEPPGLHGSARLPGRGRLQRASARLGKPALLPAGYGRSEEGGAIARSLESVHAGYALRRRPEQPRVRPAG